MLTTSINSSASCFTNSSNYPQFFKCFDYSVSFYMFIGFTVANLLLLPLCIVIVWMGFQRWRLQGSSTSGKTSQADVFTYHMTAVDIGGALGSLFFTGAVYACSQWMKMVGYYFFSFTFPAQTFLHCLTCVERYLAVVYPVKYRQLRLVGDSKIRNISIACVLLLCSGLIGLTILYLPSFPTAPFFGIFGFTVVVLLFCSLSVLRVLVRLGPGRVGGEQIDPLKLRAFYTILAITGTLVLRSCGLIIVTVIFNMKETDRNGGCVFLMSAVWMCLPSTLVLPLLFLQRAGRLERKTLESTGTREVQ